MKLRPFGAALLLACGAYASPALADIGADKVTASRVLLEKMGQGDFGKLDEIYGPGFVAHAGGKDYTLEEDNFRPGHSRGGARPAGDGRSPHWGRRSRGGPLARPRHKFRCSCRYAWQRRDDGSGGNDDFSLQGWAHRRGMESDRSARPDEPAGGEVNFIEIRRGLILGKR